MFNSSTKDATQLEVTRKKLLDQIQTQLKKADESEYGATNYTSITEYKIGRHLGAGAYAAVKQCVHRLTGMVLAIKVYEKFKLMESQRKKSVIREINALRKLNHPNIMRLYDVIDTTKQLYLVMEYVPGQMLSTFLRE